MSEQGTQTATIIGIGSGGISTLQSLSVAAPPDWTLLAVDSDSKSLQQFKLPIKILIGDGTGSQGDPAAGRAAAEASRAEISTHLQTAGLVFLLAGLGGGTGSGAAPVIARLAKESGAYVVAICMTPFAREGKSSMNKATEAFEQLRAHADIAITLPNESLLAMVTPGPMSIFDAFKPTEETVAKIIHEVISARAAAQKIEQVAAISTFNGAACCVRP